MLELDQQVQLGQNGILLIQIQELIMDPMMMNGLLQTMD
jgi:hypothetical protein